MQKNKCKHYHRGSCAWQRLRQRNISRKVKQAQLIFEGAALFWNILIEQWKNNSVNFSEFKYKCNKCNLRTRIALDSLSFKQERTLENRQREQTYAIAKERMSKTWEHSNLGTNVNWERIGKSVKSEWYNICFASVIRLNYITPLCHFMPWLLSLRFKFRFVKKLKPIGLKLSLNV